METSGSTALRPSNEQGARQGHTPGPWKYEARGSEDRGDSHGVSAPAPHHWVIPPLNLEVADMQLCAAAPDLLVALEVSEYAIQEWAADTECKINHEGLIAALKKARAAIAKARGL